MTDGCRPAAEWGASGAAKWERSGLVLLKPADFSDQAEVHLIEVLRKFKSVVDNAKVSAIMIQAK